MQAKVLVVGVIPETWFKGSKDERAAVVLNCSDRVSCAGQRMKNTFDYTLAPEELEKINPDALDGQTIVIGVREWAVGGGRIKAKGSIDLDSVPPEARRGSIGAAIVAGQVGGAIGVAIPSRDNGQTVLASNGATTPAATKGK
jgi:hypothetical protein